MEIHQRNRVRKSITPENYSRRAVRKELYKDGFKQVSDFADYLINESGRVYNLNKGLFEAVSDRNTIKANNSSFSVSKMILSAFGGQKYRPYGRIIFRDGNKHNFQLSNIGYARLFDSAHPAVISPDDLMTAIRCYVQVKPGFNIKDRFMTGIYLKFIVGERMFISASGKRMYIDVFSSYISGTMIIIETAKVCNIGRVDCAIIIHDFINILITDILSDLNNGYLQIQPFRPKQKTKTEIIREWNERFMALDIKPLPLRRSSEKELVSRYMKHLKK